MPRGGLRLRGRHPEERGGGRTGPRPTAHTQTQATTVQKVLRVWGEQSKSTTAMPAGPAPRQKQARP